MILDDYFDRVVLITLRWEEERREKALAALKDGGLAEEVLLVDAWPGSELPPPEWWRAGGGAWGCLQSHVRALSEAHQAGAKNVLVIEDDCCWQPRAAEMLRECLEKLPEDWGQFYLGGVHQWEPERLEGIPELVLGRSVNRTHCYAANRAVIPKMLQHILHAPDYIGAGFAPHVDHQLEKAHQRGDWRVYAPSWWIAGQDENHSSIQGRKHPRKWWHWTPAGTAQKLPFLIIDEEPGEDAKYLHSGWNFEKDKETPKGMGPGWITMSLLDKVMMDIANEALCMERLPGLKVPPARVEEVEKRWGAELVLRLSEVRAELPALCDYPRNGLFPHPWLNPVVDLDTRAGNEREDSAPGLDPRGGEPAGSLQGEPGEVASFPS